MTSDSKNPPLWPFLVVDALFLGAALFIFQQAHRPLLWWEVCGMISCVGAGAFTFVTPFLRRGAGAVSLLQAEKLAAATDKIQQLSQLADQISLATAQWQTIQDSAAKTAKTASDLAQNMTAEAKVFEEFLQKANDAERAHLRLEVEKLRRGESDWLQTVIRMLDQVHALHQAALQSGQPALAAQIGNFQNACRDIPRRVGLAALTVPGGEAFDPKRHQLVNDAPAADPKSLVLDTIAPGYTYQGQMVRRALVRLQNPEPAAKNQVVGPAAKN